MHGKFTTAVKKLTDDEVADRRSNLSKQIEKFTNMTKLIHEVLESTNPVTETRVYNILSSYHNLKDSKIAILLQLIKRLNQEKLQSWRSSTNQSWRSVGQSSVVLNQSWNFWKSTKEQHQKEWSLMSWKIICLRHQHYHLSGVLLMLTKYGRG